MIWSLSLDDFSGAFCNEGKYPLINAIREVLFSDKDQKNLFVSSKPNVSNSSNLLDRDRNESASLNSDRVDENFECFEDGLFADKSSGCRAFFQCFRSMSRYVLKARFLCPIGTLFNQEKLVCDWPNYLILTQQIVAKNSWKNVKILIFDQVWSPSGHFNATI
ncbi:acidic mammalian chitinase-like [Brachionus plicatilis]|uniref:Acidic mammalian chitinase-like n=1 Tax=Brachionus plicatilis TaxID=10195 RepID=A0A3M7QB79_BRAPC|nr:acidic mammalian chitinase-like [Brachionus plicatilis]